MLITEAVLTAKVAQLCQYVGFNAVTQDSLNVLVDLYRKMIVRLASNTKDASIQNQRTESTYADLLQALDFLHMPVQELDAYIKSVDLNIEFNIPEHTPKPSNRIQRDLHPDELLEVKKNVSTNNVQKKEAIEENRFAENPPPVLLKDTYQEISKNFPSNPVTALNRIRQPSPVTIKIKNPIRPKTLAERKEIPTTSSASSLPSVNVRENILDTLPPLNEPTLTQKKGKTKVAKNKQLSLKVVPKVKSKPKDELKPRIKGKKRDKLKQVEKTKANAKEKPEENIKIEVKQDEIKLKEDIKEKTKIKEEPKERTKEKLKEKSKEKSKNKDKEKRSKFTIVTQTVGQESTSEEWLCPACRKPDDGDLMLACDKCEEWYHLRCTELKAPPGDDENWECQPCVRKHKPEKVIPFKMETTELPPISPALVITPQPVIKQELVVSPEIPKMVSMQRDTIDPVVPRATMDGDDLCPECNLADDGTMMIQCDDPFCAKWFHGKCVNLLEEPKEDESWFCKVCVDKQQSAFSRRRRAK